MMRLKHLILLFCLVTLAIACKKKPSAEAELGHDFDRIRESGELTVLTLNSSVSYFLYREQPMGFHYDMIEEFCKDYNLKLTVKIGKTTAQLLEMLKNGEGDIIAYPFPLQSGLKDSIIYCGLTTISHQVLVQRQGKERVKDVTELIGREVTVIPHSKYYQRLVNLNSELGGGIVINTNVGDSLSTEELIEMVANEEINYTVADEYLAKLNRTYYRNLNIALPLSFDQRSSWVVSKSHQQLADSLDAWYNINQKKPAYTAISKKYFELSKLPFSGEFDLIQGLPKGHISPYDDLFKKAAENFPYDWQLLAGISYQESRFKNGLSSWAGATGIMGIMPNTARKYGASVDELLNPAVSIDISVKLLNVLYNVLSDIEDHDERLKFVLAAYNGGIGHIADVRALARKYGDNDSIWEGHVRNWVTKKREPQYYNDPVCKSGYFRGTETLNYVDNVLRFTERFKQETKKK